MTTLAQWRRRLEIFSLRWQARLDTKSADRAVPWIIALLLGVVLAGLALARARQLDAGVDLSSYLQGSWLIGEGYQPHSSVVGHNLLWEQAAFVLYPVAGLLTLFPDQPALLSLQAAALAIAVVPLWRIARDIGSLKSGAAAAVVLVYCAYPATHAINLSDFHPEALAVPALFAAIYHALRQRWGLFAIFALVVVACRSDLAFVVAGLGLLVMVERRRAGAWITMAGLGYGLIALTVIQPRFGGGEFPHLGAFSDYGDGNPGSVLWGMISAPHQVVADAMSQANFQMIVFLLAPVMLLPLVAPRYILPVVPLFAIYLVADVPIGNQTEASQMVPVTAFVFVAMIFALARTGRVLVERVNIDRRLLTALVLTATIFFLRDAPSSLYQEPWDWGRRDTMDEARLEVANQIIPDEVAVRASDRVLPLLSDRIRLYPLDTSGDPELAVTGAVADVEWIVFDRTSAPDWNATDVVRFDIDLRDAGFEQVEIDTHENLFIYRLNNVIRS